MRLRGLLRRTLITLGVCIYIVLLVYPQALIGVVMLLGYWLDI